MRFTSFLAVALLWLRHVEAAAVFAHFMLMNAENYTTADWGTDIQAAQDAHIDAFALNIASDPRVAQIMPEAFKVAASKGFKLFLSFDYAGNGAWGADEVAELLTIYTNLDAYYQHNGQCLVSTFEGSGSAEDWISIKEKYNVFFIPDWSSVGAIPALKLGSGVADGLFSWAAWPWGPQDMDTYTDASYTQTLNDSGSKPYMMAVSPWFFTNLPGYDKNWLWRGDDLWYDRWVEVIYNQPEFVEIISWNDYGESHYIGPLYDYALEAFKIGKAPSNFATDMPHDGWRLLLPYVIDMYKSETAQVTKEGLVSWYRLSPAAACGGGTTGNTASQLQLEYAPTEVVQDRIFFSALLTMDATVTVSVGGAVQTATWSWKPDGGIGIYHGHVPLTGSGPVVVTLSRGGTQLAQINGKSISSGCTDGLFNAWVGSASASGAVSASPALPVSKMACINGTGTGNFAGLCDFACSYGYCPISACTCRQIGRPLKAPNSTGIIGYPIAGEDASYSGLCAFNCNLGYCPESSCGTEEVPLIVPTVSDFSPPACIAGSGSGALAGLCSFSCNYGFCPRNVCTCTAQGALVPSPDVVGVTGSPVEGLEDAGLCNFACNHGYCPEGTCTGSGSATSGEVYAAPEIWKSSKPDVECIPPCRIILPPYPLKDDTTITFRSMVTSVWTKLGTSTGTKTTILSVPSLVTNAIPFWPVVIPSGMTTPAAFYPLQSVMPPSRPMVLNSNEATFSPVPSGSATPKPIFAEGTQTVTIQPQATVSVSVGSNVPSVTWSSATPSKTCTAGCGTDSCELFGGCDSSNPTDDCGTQGCGGGCSIQGCTQSCGLTCSTDQHHVDTDSDSSSSSGGSSGGSSGTAQRPTLPFDYDGPDGSTNGDWNPPPMDAELATSITSAIEAQITAIKPIYSSIYGMIEQGVATPSVPNDLKTSAQSQATSVKNSVATYVSEVQERMRDRTPNGDISAGLNWFSNTLKSIEYTLDVAANAIDSHDFVSLRAGIGATEVGIDILNREINIEAGADICDDDWPRDIGNVHLNKRAAPPSCAPDYQGDPGEPSNADAIPEELGCNSKSGYKTWSRDSILDAMKQGVKYSISYSQGASTAGAATWQQASKALYPHVYGNSDNIDFHEDCVNAGEGYSDLLEFPILADGSVLSCGRNSKTDVGTDRVVFKRKNNLLPSTSTEENRWDWVFCGVMSHFTSAKVELPPLIEGGKTRWVLPFEICKEPTTG